jgi:hypothetical protein
MGYLCHYGNVSAFSIGMISEWSIADMELRVMMRKDSPACRREVHRGIEICFPGMIYDTKQLLALAFKQR